MDRYESQKMRLQDLVKNHHSAEAHEKDIEELRRAHPEAEKLGVCHENFISTEQNEHEISMKKWGIPH